MSNPPPKKKSTVLYGDLRSAANSRATWNGGTVEDVFEYRIADGVAVLGVARIRLPDGRKDMPQYHIESRSDGGRLWALGGLEGEYPLFRLPELMAANADAPILFFEGESKAALAAQLGFEATCTAMGAGKASRTDFAPLRGRTLVVFADHDAVGADHGREVAQRARDAGAARVLVGTLPNLPDHGDIIDWRQNRIENGCTDEDLVEQLRAIVAAAPEEVFADRTGSSHANGIGDGSQPERPPRRVRPWTEVADDPPIPDMVAGLLTSVGLGLLVGPPGSGKSLLATDLPLRAAHGLAWLGRNVRPTSTIYFAGEGSQGARLRAWRAAHSGAQPANDHYVLIADGCPDLTSDEGAEELRAIIDSAAGQYGHAPGLIVIDTLAVAAAGADENDAGSMGLVVGALTALARERGLLVLVLHHLRKPQVGAPSRGASAVRGSTALVAAADVVLVATEDGDGYTLRAEKVRDGEKPIPVSYTIIGHATGLLLDNGQIEHAPIVLPADPEAPGAAGEPNLDAEAAEHIRLVVAKLREMGSAPSANSVVKRCKGKRQDLLAAWKEAIAAGTIHDTSTDKKQSNFVAVDDKQGECAPPTPPTVREPGTGGGPVPNREGGVAVPGTSGNQSGTREPRAGGEGEP